MDQKTRKKIKKAIEENDIEILKKIECEDIFEFRFSPSGKHHNGPNALLYACCYSDHATIKLIIDRMNHYFQSLMKEKGVKKGTKKYDELEESVDAKFSDFFSDEFNDGENIYNAAAIARMRGAKETKDYLLKIAGLQPSIITDVDDLKNDELVDALEDVTIEQVPDFKRAGLASDAGGILYRPPRPLSSFAGEREKQFIKHLSTMIYFNLPSTKVTRKTKKGDDVIATLAEVEIMHFIYNNVSFLFVAGNEAGMTNEFSSKFKTLEVLKKMICKAPDSISKNDKEGIKRANRYSKYIGDAIHRDILPFKEDDDNEVENDIKNVSQLRKLLKSNKTPLFFHTMAYEKRQKRSYALADKTTSFLKETLSV